MILQSVFLCLVLGWTVTAQVTVDGEGYQNVQISFAPNVLGEDGQAFIKTVRDILEDASSLLQKAIGIRIATATFLIPSSWRTEKWKNITVTPASSEQVARSPDMRVDFTYGTPFDKQPVALQHGGCGVAGHQIVLPLMFLGISGSNYLRGRQLAREWLKYRYGVFDENGFMNDPLYPAYSRVPGTSEIRIADCTDSKVNYIFTRPITNEVCDMDSVVDFGYCRTRVPRKSAIKATSSLMYYHKDLQNTEHICGKEDRPHHSTVVNKQNALCNGQSIWDVIRSSEDFKNTPKQPVDSVPKTIQFSYIQESKPRLVVLLENSDNLLGKEAPIRFALRQFYYNLPPQSKLAIYIYSSDVTDALPYTELSAEGRSDIGIIADFGLPPKKIATSIGLEKSAQVLFLENEVEKGSILLITASPLDKIPDLPPKLRDSGICLNVLSVTGEESSMDPSYDPLAKSFRCFSHLSLPSSLDDVKTSDVLNGFLNKDVPKFHGNRETKTVASGEMSAQNPLTIPRDKTASLYTLWLGKALGSSGVSCVSGGAAVALESSIAATGIASFTLKPTKKNITCQLISAKQVPVLTQILMETGEGQYIVFDTWIQDRSTGKEQLPIIIHAKIYFGGFPVKEANVKTVVTSGGKQVVVKMLDNGRGDPDITQYDGIYSGYFTKFLTAGQYQISVTIDDNQGQAKFGKKYEELEPDACCGSKIVSKDYDLPSFQMSRLILYTARNKRPQDGYPPSKILDLQAKIFSISDKVILIWTAPGGEKAARYTLKLFKNRHNAISKFETTGQELNTTGKIPGDAGKVEGFVIPFSSLNENKTYYATIRSLNEFNKPSEISNVAEFVPKQIGTTGDEVSSTPSSTTWDGSTTKGKLDNEDPPKNSSNKTVGIVLGVLGGIAVLGILGYLGYYFFAKKRRRN